MYKRRLCLLCLVILILAAACAQGDPKPSSQPSGNLEPVTAGSNAETPAKTGYVYEYEGTKIAMNDDMADILQKLGEPKKYFEAPSCAFNGIDKIYAYPGIEIHTYPEGDKDFVLNINFKDDSISTPEGLFLGSSLQDMLDKYGEGYTRELDMYTYPLDNTYLSILIEDDTVVSIIYGLTV